MRFLKLMKILKKIHFIIYGNKLGMSMINQITISVRILDNYVFIFLRYNYALLHL